MDSSPRSALFREIHKNTWLKRITSDVKKLSVVGAKRSEKFWVVFCVHDDFDALLEGYTEPRLAPSHSPEWTISLQQTQHISHALVPLEQEYEFVITLNTDCIRFSASSWEIMQEWVDTLRSKLREMKILSPRENIYSKLPEIRAPLLPTRDPTSPLPAPPPVPAALVPGIERITPPVMTAAASTVVTTTTQNTPAATSAMSNTLTQNLIAMLSSPIANLRQQSDEPSTSSSGRVTTITSPSSSSSSSQGSLTNGSSSPAKKTLASSKPSSSSTKATQSLAKTFTDNVLADPNTCPPSTSTQDDTVEVASNGIHQNVEESDCISVESLPVAEPIVIPRPQTQKRRQSPSTGGEKREFEASSSPKTNVTIIQVAPSSEPPLETVSLLSVSTADESPENEHQFKCNVKINPSSIPSVSASPGKVLGGVEISSVHIPSASATNHYGKICNVSTEGQKVTVTTTSSNFATNISVEESPITGSVYEQVFITATTSSAPVTVTAAADMRVVNLLATQARSASHSEITVNREASGSSGTPRKEKKSSPQKAVRPALTRGATEAVLSRPSRVDKNLAVRMRGPPNGNDAAGVPKSRSQVSGQSLNSQDPRKRSSSTSDAQQSRNISAPGVSSTSRSIQVPSNFRPPPDGSAQTPPSLGRLTLREQQVMHMRREMMHPGGVRLQLRRKDCLGSIAWVDAFGAVWVTGWKQKEHPMLYNALHIGDQLISVGGVTVGSSADANKLIRSTLGLYVELIIRRVPFGRCYAIRRDLDGQCLGLVRDSATVVDLVPNSLAARHGLPPKAQTCDGLSLTFWVLTEINGRPLNLFAKETEVKDRLNAVGRDISILVQPSDLVTKLKKQLKSLRSHKDYIVQ
ncbi:uncharacterized protein DMENIID0001_027490 [Sergentomyia squamirostris]